MNKFVKFARVGVPSGLLLAGMSAHAALPAAVTTAISDAGADLVTAATAVIVAIAGFWGLRTVGKKIGLWA
jgi:hypothetical protein